MPDNKHYVRLDGEAMSAPEDQGGEGGGGTPGTPPDGTPTVAEAEGGYSQKPLPRCEGTGSFSEVSMNSQLKPFMFEAGTVVHVNGVPFYLSGAAFVLGTPENYQNALSGACNHPDRICDPLKDAAR